MYPAGNLVRSLGDESEGFMGIVAIEGSIG